jgi:hypothetical protein
MGNTTSSILYLMFAVASFRVFTVLYGPFVYLLENRLFPLVNLNCEYKADPHFVRFSNPFLSACAGND